jgi:stress response protein YsnF
MNERKSAEADGRVTLRETEERVEIDKRTTDEGGVRAVRRSEEATVPVDTQLRRQRVRVDRHPREEILDTVPETRREGATTIIPVVEERLVKCLVLVEEVHLTLEDEEVPVRREETVRRNVVDIERL